MLALSWSPPRPQQRVGSSGARPEPVLGGIAYPMAEGHRQLAEERAMLQRAVREIRYRWRWTRTAARTGSAPNWPVC
ncbi:hypothetical protein [Saccharopolyspora pogona]|uniref:hypothetical protein n=1 Tax=Saccharopolyspora pogona TaxID=333966 RepID=UPI001CC23FCC|nr:hypothetical protein [Saccharopolyspora pogona]